MVKSWEGSLLAGVIINQGRSRVGRQQEPQASSSSPQPAPLYLGHPRPLCSHAAGLVRPGALDHLANSGCPGRLLAPLAQVGLFSLPALLSSLTFVKILQRGVRPGEQS